MKIADKPEGRKRDPLLRHIWFQISKFSLDCQTNTETKIWDKISVEFTFHEIDESKTETEKNRDNKAVYTALGAPKHLYKRVNEKAQRTNGPTDRRMDRPSYRGLRRT